MNEKQTKMLEKGEFAEYSGYHKDSSEGHIFLAKEGACTITLSGAASMSQEELDKYGNLFAHALSVAYNISTKDLSEKF